MNACCISSAKIIRPNKQEYLQRELEREIRQAVEDGYTTFISGFDDGADLDFAAIVAGMKEDKPKVFLEAAVAHRGKLKGRSERFVELLKKVNGIKPVSDEEGPDCDFALNRYFISICERVIAVFDGDTESFTGQTIRMAQSHKRELKIIEV